MNFSQAELWSCACRWPSIFLPELEEFPRATDGRATRGFLCQVRLDILHCIVWATPATLNLTGDSDRYQACARNFISSVCWRSIPSANVGKRLGFAGLQSETPCDLSTFLTIRVSWWGTLGTNFVTARVFLDHHPHPILAASLMTGMKLIFVAAHETNIWRELNIHESQRLTLE